MEHQHDHHHDSAHDSNLSGVHEPPEAEPHVHGSGHQPHHSHQHEPLSPAAYAASVRAAKDEYMRADPSSPLTAQQRASFAGLRYFPYDETLSMRLPLDRDVSSDPVQMGTSTGESREYTRVGKIHFEVGGVTAELTVYGEPDDLFLPLRDSTSGHATYGAGRYLEPTMWSDDTVFVDFNLLYNPYCAYNEQFSCPLPPAENWLKVPIEAGEQNFEHQAED